MKIIANRITDTERLARYVLLGLSDEENKDLLAYDKAVEAGKPTPHDLSPEKQKIAQKFAHAGIRKTPTTYNFTQRQRKPNATKGGLIVELADFLEKSSAFDVKNLSIPNKERLISFTIGDNTFEVILQQKRKPKI